MSWAEQIARPQASQRPDAARAVFGREVRPLPPGVGLGVGLVVSLALWGGLGLAVMRLLG